MFFYTDGSYRPATNKEAASVIGVNSLNEVVINDVQKFVNTTAQRMELRAILNALKISNILSFKTISIFSDSKYSVDALNIWLPTWIRRGWKTNSRRKVCNKDLFEAILRERNGLNVTFSWIKAHCGHPFNSLADYMAGLHTK